MKFQVISSADAPRARTARSAWSSKTPVGKSAGSTGIWTASMSAVWPTKPCTATPTTCCTSCAGGRAFITLAISPQADLTESTLLDYLRFQSSRQPPPSATTINDRVADADRAIRNEFPDAPCQVAHGFHKIYLHRRPMGLGRPRFEPSAGCASGNQAQHRAALGR